jgi:hypothetical protein
MWLSRHIQQKKEPPHSQNLIGFQDGREAVILFVALRKAGCGPFRHFAAAQ